MRLAEALGLSIDQLLEGHIPAEAVTLKIESFTIEDDTSILLADLIRRSRSDIAQIAGLPWSKVRVTLDSGD